MIAAGNFQRAMVVIVNQIICEDRKDRLNGVFIHSLIKGIMKRLKQFATRLRDRNYMTREFVLFLIMCAASYYILVALNFVSLRFFNWAYFEPEGSYYWVSWWCHSVFILGCISLALLATGRFWFSIICGATINFIIMAANAAKGKLLDNPIVPQDFALLGQLANLLPEFLPSLREFIGSAIVVLIALGGIFFWLLRNKPKTAMSRRRLWL